MTVNLLAYPMDQPRFTPVGHNELTSMKHPNGVLYNFVQEVPFMWAL